MRRILLSLVGSGLAAWTLALPVRAEIKVGDSLQLVIRGVPAGEKAMVEGHYVVGKSGTIQIPLAEVPVKAAGLSAEALARRIEAVFRNEQIYTRPSIQILTKATDDPRASAQVSVGGQVRRPGGVKFRNGMTLLQAVQGAGDLNPFGSKRRIFVTRGKQRWVVDLRTAKGQAFPVQSGDTIVVDQRKPLEGN